MGIDDSTDDDTSQEDDYSFGKVLCAFGVVICGLLMFTLPLSKLILPIDLFTHFSLHYMLIGGAMLIGFFVPRWNWQIAVILSFASVVLIGFAARNQSEPVEQVAGKGEKRIKLMTFNTWLRNKNWQAIAKEISETKPDIVTLMEFGIDKKPLLRALKSQYPYQKTCHTLRYCHMAVLSRFPFIDSNVRFRWRGPPYIRISFGRQLGNLNLFAIHTTRPPHYRSHFKQIGALSAAVNDRKGIKIVMGDFNSTPFSRTLNAFSKRTGLKRITDTPSWPAHMGGLPQVAIDHIFLSPKIKVLAPDRIGNQSGSDHFPINAVVAVPTSE